MIHKLSIAWNVAFVISLGVSGLVAIAQQILLNEVENESNEERDKIEYIK